MNVTRPEVECGEVSSRLEHMSSRDDLLSLTTSVDILEVRGARQGRPSAKWKTNLGHDALLQYLDFSTQNSSLGNPETLAIPDLRVIFIGSREGYGVNAHPSTLEWLQETLDISPVFISYILDFQFGASGRMGNALFSKRDTYGRVSSIEGFYHYSSSFRGQPGRIWFCHNVLTLSSSYFALHCPVAIQEQILKVAQSKNVSSLLRIGAIDALISDNCSRRWGKNIAEARQQLLKYERMTASQLPSSSVTATASQELHALSQNWHITIEDLTDEEERLHYLLDLRKRHASAVRSHDLSYPPEQRSVDDSLEYLLSRNGVWKRWIVNYNERTKIRINLFFNLASQSDNRTNLEIADLTSKIAVETQRDSSSMITIAAVTMFFLPGTFVSAIFSMVFFSVGSDGNIASFRVSPRWWYFLAVTIPLTIVVFAVWLVWKRIRGPDEIKVTRLAETR